MTTETRNGPCERCSTTVFRELLPQSHPLAETFNALPMWCDTCIEADVELQKETYRREQQKREDGMYIFRRKDSGLPEKYFGRRVAELDQPADVIAAARGWVENGGGLLLTGDIGRGKTTIAGAAAGERLRWKQVRWTSAPLLFARLGSGFGSDQRQGALDLLSSRGALVLDDIDKARPTEYGAEQLFLAVDQRVENQDPLLVTSNLAPSQLAEKWPEPYGPAIASRLVGYCKVVRVEGFDRRLRAAS